MGQSGRPGRDQRKSVLSSLTDRLKSSTLKLVGAGVGGSTGHRGRTCAGQAAPEQGAPRTPRPQASRQDTAPRPPTSGMQQSPAAERATGRRVVPQERGKAFHKGQKFFPLVCPPPSRPAHQESAQATQWVMPGVRFWAPASLLQNQQAAKPFSGPLKTSTRLADHRHGEKTQLEWDRP